MNEMKGTSGGGIKVLWICNLILPEIAEQLRIPSIPKEGWIEGLLDGLLRETEPGEGGTLEADGGSAKQLRLVLAFPVARELDGRSGSAGLAGYPGRKVSYDGFYENTIHPEDYDPELEVRLAGIIEKEMPDVVHCFGTEYPHTLAAARVLRKMREERGDASEGGESPACIPELLISIQGPCTIYAQEYLAHLPERAYRSRTIRDILRRDSILQQQEKFQKRGKHEREAAALAGHLAGRTEFDRELCAEWNPDAVYHHAGETLRGTFYESVGAWKPDKARAHRIFVSQADYPLKGFHYLLQAVGELVAEAPERYGDIEIYAAGQSVMNAGTWKEKLKLSAYGKYLRELVREFHLEERIHILGRLSAEKMKEQYLSCGVYVCASACENSPNSLGEAMLLGVPCVAADVGGISSMFADGEDGWLYRNRREDAPESIVRSLKGALGAVWEDPAEGVRRGRNASAHALRNHDPERNARELLGIYRELCR